MINSNNYLELKHITFLFQEDFSILVLLFNVLYKNTIAKIKLTRDSYITSLEDRGTSYSNIDFNGYKLYVDGKAIN